MSLGKLTLLSAVCLGSGAVVGSSRTLAESSGTWGAPERGGWFAPVTPPVVAAGTAGAFVGATGASAARVLRIATPADSVRIPVKVPRKRCRCFILFQVFALAGRIKLILNHVVETGGWDDQAFERLKVFFAHLNAMLSRWELE